MFVGLLIFLAHRRGAAAEDDVVFEIGLDRARRSKCDHCNRDHFPFVVAWRRHLLIQRQFKPQFSVIADSHPVTNSFTKRSLFVVAIGVVLSSPVSCPR